MEKSTVKNITNCNIHTPAGNMKEEAILELAKAMGLLAKALATNTNNVYGIYMEGDHYHNEKELDTGEET